MSGLALGISASARAFSIAVRDPDGTITTARPDTGGAGDLSATIADLFDERGYAPCDITELRLDIGPGSYTGLRVAVTFARVTAAFRDVPVRISTSLELTALAAWNHGDVAADRIVRPVLDARRNRFHHAPVRMGEHVELVAEPIATEFAALAAAIGPAETLLADDALHEQLRATLAPVLGLARWDASALFDPRLRPRESSVAALEPLYLMGSYAE